MATVVHGERDTTRTDPNLVIVASHDDEQRMKLEKKRLLGGRFD